MLIKSNFFKKITMILAFIIIIILSLQAPWQSFLEGKVLKLEITLKMDHDDTIQVFYCNNQNDQFNETNSLKTNLKGSSDFQTVKLDLPIKNLKQFRVDMGSQPGEIAINSIVLKNFNKQHVWTSDKILQDFQASEDVDSILLANSTLYIQSKGLDPFFTSEDLNDIPDSVSSDNSTYLKLIISLLVILLCSVYIFLIVYKRLFAFLKEIVKSRRLIFELAKKDLKNRFLGSYLGIVWAFVQPMITITIFWFVFQVGFKSAPIEDFPFVLWLLCGLVPWFFFSESLQNATNSILDNSYLVKKVVFRISTLPIIRILSSLFIHLFFILVIFIMFAIYGYMPSIYNLQVLYYLFATIFLLLGITWITSSLVVFFRDLGQIVSILIQFGFWLTPIFWSFNIMPEKYIFFIKLNPVYYIVEGYRDSFIKHIWFWQHYNLTINFWIITLGIFFTGALLFKRLRPHLADVL